MDRKLMKATFAGGCFWCMQPPFQQIEGVTEVVAGYPGGTKEKPAYEEVSSGTTGHLESVQVTYDPDKVPYEKLSTSSGRRSIRLTMRASSRTRDRSTGPPSSITMTGRSGSLRLQRKRSTIPGSSKNL